MAYLLLAFGMPLVPIAIVIVLPLAVTGRQLAGTCARAAAEKPYASTIIAPMPSDFSRARALARQGNVNEALKEYRGYFEENPGSATPLFEAAQFLEEQRRYGQCVGYYREIMKTFEHQKGVWAEAGVRLATIFSDYLNDWKKAEPILNEVAKTVPRTEQARQARERLHSASRQGALTH
jgi:tetratricopeptide (TPR) repeat protein